MFTLKLGGNSPGSRTVNKQNQLTHMDRYRGRILGGRVSHPKNSKELSDGLAQARLEQSIQHERISRKKAIEYEQQKFMEEQKKRLAKLKKYKGIGLLGNQLGESSNPRDTIDELPLTQHDQSVENDSISEEEEGTTEEQELVNHENENKQQLTEMNTCEGVGMAVASSSRDESECLEEIIDGPALVQHSQSTDQELGLVYQEEVELTEQPGKDNYEEEQNNVLLNEHEAVGFSSNQLNEPKIQRALSNGLKYARHKQSIQNDLCIENWKKKADQIRQEQIMKEQKKRLEKLKRYQGVGLLGDRLGGPESQNEINDRRALVECEQLMKNDSPSEDENNRADHVTHKEFRGAKKEQLAVTKIINQVEEQNNQLDEAKPVMDMGELAHALPKQPLQRKKRGERQKTGVEPENTVFKQEAKKKQLAVTNIFKQVEEQNNQLDEAKPVQDMGELAHALPKQPLQRKKRAERQKTGVEPENSVCKKGAKKEQLAVTKIINQVNQLNQLDEAKPVMDMGELAHALPKQPLQSKNRAEHQKTGVEPENSMVDGEADIGGHKLGGTLRHFIRGQTEHPLLKMLSKNGQSE